MHSPVPVNLVIPADAKDVAKAAQMEAASIIVHVSLP